MERGLRPKQVVGRKRSAYTRRDETKGSEQGDDDVSTDAAFFCVPKQSRRLPARWHSEKQSKRPREQARRRAGAMAGLGNQPRRRLLHTDARMGVGRVPRTQGCRRRRPGDAALWTELEIQIAVDRNLEKSDGKGRVGMAGDRPKEEKPGGVWERSQKMRRRERIVESNVRTTISVWGGDVSGVARIRRQDAGTGTGRGPMKRGDETRGEEEKEEKVVAVEVARGPSAPSFYEKQSGPRQGRVAPA